MENLTQCPACDHQDFQLFYEISNIPVHSCLMLDSREEALNFPRNDLKLCFCNDCGFIFNMCFDPVWSAYAPNYEDQQSFSPTFNSFAGKLARDLVERYDLNEKKIIEIGCSKGDFLALLCEAGNNHGIGIDPSAVPGRVHSPAMKNIQFINEYYSEKHLSLPADFICSRHTLEHIQPVKKFLSLIKQATETTSSKPVMIEIPDVKRVLQSAAFEDIYYEHCSYFTPGTYARLLRSTGFNVTDLRLEYQDQYLIAECGPKSSSVTLKFPDEESLEETKDLVKHFKREFDKKLKFWSGFFQSAKQESKKIAIWGSGSKCVSFYSTLGLTDEISMVVDINPNRQGKYIPGIAVRISAPEDLSRLSPDFVIVMNNVYEAEIRRDLGNLEVSTKTITL